MDETRVSLIMRLPNREDDQAWQEFVEIYEPLIYGLARRNGLQHADALELTQDVLVAVSRAIDRFEFDPAKGKFRSWLFTVARNTMINFLASRKNRVLGSGDTNVRMLLEQEIQGDSQESAIFDSEYKRRVFEWAAERVKQKVKPETWDAFQMACLEQVPSETVAKKLGITVANVYLAKSRVISRIRKEVDRVQSEDSSNV